MRRVFSPAARLGQSAPSPREEEYRRRTFEAVGLPDVGGIAAALRRLLREAKRRPKTRSA